MTKSLVIAVHELGSPMRVGAWYYTSLLARLNDATTYISAPLSPFHFVFLHKKDVQQRFIKLRNDKTTYFEKVSVHNLFSLSPGGPVWPFNTSLVLNSTYTMSLPRLKERHYDLVYCDNPYLYSILKNVRFTKLVVRVPDVLPLDKKRPNHALIQATGWLVERADLVISVSSAVKYQIKDLFSKESVVISNGVDVSRFSKLRMLPESYKKELKYVVYVGAFDYWLDLEIVNSLIKRRIDTQFILIGQVSGNIKKSLESLNVHFTGPLHPDEVVAYLQHADVGIIPFDVTNHKEFVDGINPLKAYEYLAAGIPVVSTDFAGAQGISPYVTTAASAEEFCQAVANYLDNPPDRDAVRKTAEPYDWSVVLKPFEDFVKKSLGKSDES